MLDFLVGLLRVNALCGRESLTTRLKPGLCVVEVASISYESIRLGSGVSARLVELLPALSYFFYTIESTVDGAAILLGVGTAPRDCVLGDAT